MADYAASIFDARSACHARTSLSRHATRPGETLIGAGNSPRRIARQAVVLPMSPAIGRTSGQRSSRSVSGGVVTALSPDFREIIWERVALLEMHCPDEIQMKYK
jgi:hypothetical protein